MTAIENKRKQLINELFTNTKQEERCPYIRRNNESTPFCGKDYNGGKISEERKMVCDIASLQLWCLNKSHCEKCIFYQGELIE